MSELTVKTNNHARLIMSAYELTEKELSEFDYLPEGEGSFFRYRGNVYDLGEFMTTSTMPDISPLKKWDGYCSDSYFSGIVVRYYDNFESVIVGTFYC